MLCNGRSVTHIENYQGLSGTRNMAFEMNCSQYRYREYQGELDKIGMLVYTFATKTTPKTNFKMTCRGVEVVMNMCLDFDIKSRKFSILLYT